MERGTKVADNFLVCLESGAEEKLNADHQPVWVNLYFYPIA